MLDEAEVTYAREYHMVEEGDAESIGRFLEPAGDIAILRARLESARRMIMRHDHCAGAVGYRVGVYFAGVDDRRPPLISTIRYRQV